VRASDNAGAVSKGKRKFRAEPGEDVTALRESPYGVSSNPRQPHKRVRRALAKYVKGNVGLPKQWTPAQVRVNDKGQVQVKVNPDKLGSGTRFARCVKAVAEKGGAYDPKAVCASAGRKKYGARKMASMAKAGRKRKNPGKTKTYKVHVPATSKDSGYDLTITAKSSSNAIKQARAYCAKRAGVPTSQYHLPKATKARAA
jgi:hypothetical protein